MQQKNHIHFSASVSNKVQIDQQ